VGFFTLRRFRADEKGKPDIFKRGINKKARLHFMADGLEVAYRFFIFSLKFRAPYCIHTAIIRIGEFLIGQ